jgi:hypothetical protein
MHGKLGHANRNTTFYSRNNICVLFVFELEMLHRSAYKKYINKCIDKETVSLLFVLTTSDKIHGLSDRA